MASNRIKTGNRVRVTEGAGSYSGRVGTVQPRSSVKTDGEGVPRGIPGCYNPITKDDYVIKEDNGNVFLMFRNYLTNL